MKYTIIINGLGTFEGDTVDVSDRNTVCTTLFPNFLNNNIWMHCTIKINLAKGDTVHIAKEESTDFPVVLPVDITWLLGLGRHWGECGDDGYQQTEEKTVLFHGFKDLRISQSSSLIQTPASLFSKVTVRST